MDWLKEIAPYVGAVGITAIVLTIINRGTLLSVMTIVVEPIKSLTVAVERLVEQVSEMKGKVGQ